MKDPQSSLSTRLRELRTTRKMPQDRLAASINVSKSLVQSFESGKLIPQEDTAKNLDEFFGTGDELQGLAKDEREDRRPLLRSWADHEKRAALLRTWELSLIPGLLQVPEYMRVLFEAAPGNEGRVDDLMAIRLARQAAVFDRERPIALSCLIGESALRQGPREIMKPQLEHLVDAGHRSNVRIKIVPDRLGLHVGLGGPISMATMSDGRRVSYLDDQLRGRVVATTAELVELELIWEAIDELALPAIQSRDVILGAIDELK